MNSNELPNHENMEKNQAHENFSKWNEALVSKDAKSIAALYTEKCVLLATFSDELITDRPGVESYFVGFCKKNPSGEIVNEDVTFTSEDCYNHSGLYNFTVGEPEAREVVKARFTYTWVKQKTGEWLIQLHHSSALPVKH